MQHRTKSAFVIACSLAFGGIASADTLYVSDQVNGAIYTVAPTGAVSLFAQLPMGSTPYGLALNAEGDLFVADNDHIDKVTPSGQVSVFSKGLVSIVSGLAFDAGGTLFAGSDSGRVYRLSPDGVATTAFTTTLGGTSALAFAPNGDLYAANQNAQVIKFNPDGSSSFFGTNTRGAADVKFGSDGNLYTTYYEQGKIDKITPAGVETVFASGLATPASLAFDSMGELIVTDLSTETVNKIDSNGAVTAFAMVSNAYGIAVLAPEPTSIVMTLPAFAWIIRRRRTA